VSSDAIDKNLAMEVHRAGTHSTAELAELFNVAHSTAELAELFNDLSQTEKHICQLALPDQETLQRDSQS